MKIDAKALKQLGEQMQELGASLCEVLGGEEESEPSDEMAMEEESPELEDSEGESESVDSEDGGEEEDKGKRVKIAIMRLKRGK